MTLPDIENPEEEFVRTVRNLDVVVGANAICGRITVTTAGTAIQGGNVELNNGVYIKALVTNTKTGYIGNDGNGDIASTNGFPLIPGETVLVQVSNLSDLWFDMGTGGDGEGFAWMKA